jgi:methyltransferase
MLSLTFVLFALIVVTRLFELDVSRRRRHALIARGAAPIHDPGFLAMVSLHVGILSGGLVEVLVTRRAVPVGFGLAAAGVVLAASALRIWSIRTLGAHWNVGVVDSTAFGVVTSGPYRFVRHPNYMAVFLELAFLPLVQGAWITAALGTALHVAVLRRRIALEESMLFGDPGYVASMGHKPRFLPRLFGRNPALARVRP